MKRKIFSKLLMGAFLIASVSSFVSCKDYDDDINNLQKQIDAAALKADLTALQQTLAAQISAAQSAADRAQAAAEAAQATANNAATKDALDAVKTIASNAGATAAQAIADAANAKADAANAAAAAAAAQGTADAAATKDALEAVKAIANNAGTAAEKAAADAAKAIADAAAAQNTANVAQTAAAAAQEAAKVAQAAAEGANTNAAKALADAASALTGAAAAQETAKAAQTTATSADATAKEAKATADNAIAAAANAAGQAAEAVTAANAAKVAAEAAKYNDEAVRNLIAQAQKSADDAAEDAKDAATAAAAAVVASASASEDAAAAKTAAAKIDEAITAATNAITAATDAKVKAAVAEAVAQAKSEIGAIPADQSAAIEKLTGDLQTLADAQAKLATAEGLSDAVTKLEGELGETVEAAAAAAAGAAAATIATAVDALYAAVTSVELVASYTGWDLNPDADAETYPLGFTASTSTNITLDFIFGKQQWTATFGDKETESLDDDADKKISYKKGDDIRANRALLIRVNPTNATFTKDQVKFINSKLETLDEIVEIGDPYRFKGMITRGSQESGLWVIPVKVKENVGFNKFNETTFYKGSAANWKYDKNTGDLETWRYESKLYAVAINNTTDMDDEDGVARYVASTYDVAAEYVHYTPATVLNAHFDWTLDDVDMHGTTRNSYYTDNGIYFNNIIHNRWTTYANYSDPGSGVRSKDQTNAYSVVPEVMEKSWLVWSNTSDEWKAGLVAPTAAEPTKTIEKTVKGAKKYNTQDDGTDYRYGSGYLTVANVGDPIRVYLPSWLQSKVEYWYISYDFELNAVESKPSEWEAWQSYQDEIDGIFKMTRGDKPIDLVVNKANAQGDVIGFRVWAVNYDGSLVDPDGKAFYIKLGEEPDATTLTITANVMAVNAATGVAANYLTDEDKTFTADKGYNVSTITKVDGNVFKSLNDWNSFGTNRSYSINWGTGFSGRIQLWSNGADDDVIFNGTSVHVNFALLKSDKKTIATDWKDVAYIKAGIDGADLINLRDEATLELGTFTGTRKDVNNPETYKLTVKVKKQMPDDAFTKKNFFDGMITWKTDYGWDPATNVLTTYVKPYYDLVPYGMDYLKPHFIKGTGGAADRFYWRWQGGAAATMAAWINDAEWLNWDYSANTNLANAGVRMIDDYIASVKPECNKALYKWVFKGMPTQLTGNGEPTSKDYTALWTTGVANQDYSDNGVIAAMPKAVREDAQFNSELKYTYKNISATNKWNNSVLTWTRGDLDRNANTFKTDFKDAMDLLTYNTSRTYLVYDQWAKNAIDVPVITGQKYLPDANLYIDWLGTNGGTNLSTFAANTDFNANLFRLGFVDMRESVVGTAASQSFNPNTFDKFANLNPGSNNLTNFLIARISDSDKVLAENKQMIANICNGAGVDRDNAADGAFGNANQFKFNENHYKFDDPNRKATDPVVTAMKIELEGAITTYLKVSTTATPTAMVFQKIGGVQDPHQNVPGTIKLSGFDVFGKQHVFNIPVVIIFNK